MARAIDVLAWIDEVTGNHDFKTVTASHNSNLKVVLTEPLRICLARQTQTKTGLYGKPVTELIEVTVDLSIGTELVVYRALPATWQKTKKGLGVDSLATIFVKNDHGRSTEQITIRMNGTCRRRSL